MPMGSEEGASGAPSLVLGVAMSMADFGQSLCVAYDLQTRSFVSKSTAERIRWYTCNGKSAAAERDLWAAVDACLAAAGGRGYSDVAAACVCAAVREAGADLADLAAALAKRLPAGAVKVARTEGAAALAACTQGALHGVAVISDDHTETVAFADGGRRSHRCSGWGPLFMDSGCCVDMGARALLAVLKAHDGRGAPTTLTRAFLRRLQLARPEDLVTWAYSPNAGQVERVAGLARCVVECAMAGDAVADTILRHGVGELQRASKAAAAAVGLGANGSAGAGGGARTAAAFKVVLAGKLLQDAGLFSHYVSEAIRDQVPGAEVCYLESEPAEAAALLALQELAAQQPQVAQGR